MKRLLLIIAMALCPLAQADEREDYVEKVAPLAIEVKSEYGIPVSATIAISIYESGYGKSKLAEKYHNYFGLKASSRKSSILLPTKDLGKRVIARFMKFDNIKEGFLGFGEFLKKEHYQKAHSKKTGIGFVNEILKAGYCPDRDYLRNIAIIIRRHNLEAYDLVQIPKKFEFTVEYCYNSHVNRNDIIQAEN